MHIVHCTTGLVSPGKEVPSSKQTQKEEKWKEKENGGERRGDRRRKKETDRDRKRDKKVYISSPNLKWSRSVLRVWSVKKMNALEKKGY